jgi:hypothetical protein
MKEAKLMLKKITESPWLNLVAGIILLLTAGTEVWESFGDGSVGTHHGVFIFGLIHIIKTIPEFMHGLHELEDGQESFSKK